SCFAAISPRGDSKGLARNARPLASAAASAGGGRRVDDERLRVALEVDDGDGLVVRQRPRVARVDGRGEEVERQHVLVAVRGREGDVGAVVDALRRDAVLMDVWL